MDFELQRIPLTLIFNCAYCNEKHYFMCELNGGALEQGQKIPIKLHCKECGAENELLISFSNLTDSKKEILDILKGEKK